MHHIFTHMYSTVSIALLYMEGLTGFLHVPLPEMTFPHISPQNLFVLLRTHYFFTRTFKIIQKQIHNLPSQETIPDRQA